MRTTIFLIVIALMLQLSSCEETGEKGSLVVTGVSAVSEAAQWLVAASVCLIQKSEYNFVRFDFLLIVNF